MNKAQLPNPSTDNAQACKHSECHSVLYILVLDFSFTELSQPVPTAVYSENVHVIFVFSTILHSYPVWKCGKISFLRISGSSNFLAKMILKPMLENSWIKEIFSLLYYRRTSVDWICPFLWLVRSAAKWWHFNFQAREEKAIVGLIHAFRKNVDDRHDIGMSVLLCNNISGQLPALILNV